MCPNLVPWVSANALVGTIILLTLLARLPQEMKLTLAAMRVGRPMEDDKGPVSTGSVVKAATALVPIV